MDIAVCLNESKYLLKSFILLYKTNLRIHLFYVSYTVFDNLFTLVIFSHTEKFTLLCCQTNFIES